MTKKTKKTKKRTGTKHRCKSCGRRDFKNARALRSHEGWHVRLARGDKIPGRPTKCTPQTRDLIAGEITRGIHSETAAWLAGITPRTYHNWMEWGEEEYATEPERRHPDRSHFMDFFQVVSRARAKREADIVKAIRAQGVDLVAGDAKQARQLKARLVRSGDGRLLIELLRRLEPERWNIAQGVQVSGKGKRGEIPLSLIVDIMGEE